MAALQVGAFTPLIGDWKDNVGINLSIEIRSTTILTGCFKKAWSRAIRIVESGTRSDCVRLHTLCIRQLFRINAIVLCLSDTLLLSPFTLTTCARSRRTGTSAQLRHAFRD